MSNRFSVTDHALMARALRLAERGQYGARPNPMVGCVIAQGEQIVGEGWHERAGEAHAEVNALRMAGELARGATAYVTLEPCAHHGRTPPCTEALMAAGVARVVVAMQDPFPSVDGAGVARLRAAGIRVDAGLMATQARALNKGFLSRVEQQRPWVRIKLGMSQDARTALTNGESKWITSAASRQDVQRWRARAGAVLSGSGTVLADDPQLTVRLPETPDIQSVRVILDRQLRTPATARVLDGQAETWVFHAQDAVVPAHFSRTTCLPVHSEGAGLNLTSVLQKLAERQINAVQVEAGATLCGALFEQGLVDELLLYVAPVFLGSQARPILNLPSLSDMQDRWALQIVDERAVGVDRRLLLRPVR